MPTTPNPENATATSKRSPVLRWIIISLVLVGVAGAVAWNFGLLPGGQPQPRTNAIMTIAPYLHNGTWVFDDSSVGLMRKPFVAGVPEMIDVLVKDVPHAEKGFRLLFSANPFPGYQKKLTWKRGDAIGNYYSIDDPPLEGWICPAMFRYYTKPPKELYVRAEAIKR